MADLIFRAITKKRTWLALFLVAYASLLSSSWSLLISIRSWYAAAPGALAALWASAAYGGTFGILSAAAATAVAVPAMVVTWITVVVLLALRGRPRRRLVEDGRRVTADIARVALGIVVREGNAVAASCAIMSFFFLFRQRGTEEEDLIVQG